MTTTASLKTVLLLLLLLAAGPLEASSQADEGLAAVSGGTLFYRSAGSGPPVLLLHGYSNSSMVWAPYTKELATQHRVVAFDLPGHGRSQYLSSTFSHRSAAAFLIEAAESLGISSFHVVGHSSGGVIALHMALLRPERVLSIVTIATPWRVSDSVRQMAGEMSVDKAPQPMLEALRSWHPGGTEQITWLLQQQARMAADPTEMALTDEQLQHIQVPTLVVHGDRDPLLPVSSAVDLVTRLPQGSLLVLPGGKHELVMQSGLVFRLLAAAVSDFVGDQTPSPSLQRTPPE